MYEYLTNLINRLYDLAYIERWNDHPKPFYITELDKQAHKAVIAFILAKFEEERKLLSLDWDKLIRGLIFEAIQRSILTDIKPQVFHKIIKNNSVEVNNYVVGKIKKDRLGEDSGMEDFYGQFESYFTDKNTMVNEKMIIKASHYLATYWEFQMIYSIAPNFYGIETIKQEIENELEDHSELIGVERISRRERTYNFVDLAGQLRFQKRWTQTPRIPMTSVLGHMFMVAVLSYIFSYKIEPKACPKRKYNNFFGALFHDLPEVTTRDIISPIKEGIPELKETIKRYEKEQVEEKILPLLPEFLQEEFRYITGFVDNAAIDEFSNRVKINDTVKAIESKELCQYNDDKYSPVDGKLIKACDWLCALTEALKSISHGIKSAQLQSSINNLEEALKDIGKTQLQYINNNINFSDVIDKVKTEYEK